MLVSRVLSQGYPTCKWPGHLVLSLVSSAARCRPVNILVEVSWKKVSCDEEGLPRKVFFCVDMDECIILCNDALLYCILFYNIILHLHYIILYYNILCGCNSFIYDYADAYYLF